MRYITDIDIVRIIGYLHGESQRELKEVSITHKIEAIRLGLGLSPSGLASKAGVSPSVIDRIEKGLAVRQHKAYPVIQYLNGVLPPNQQLSMDDVVIYGKK